MDGDSRLSIIAAIILLFCAMFFAVTEISISSTSKVRMKVLADSGNKKAKKVLNILENFDKAISTILICTNIVHISIATLVTVYVTKRWGVSFVSLSTIITTMVVFFAGEMLPKSIAKKYAESLAMACAGPLKFFMFVFSPLSALLSAIGVGASKLIKGEPELSVTEDEILDIIEDLKEDGALDEKQSHLISSAIQFADLSVESILTPRMDISGVDINMSTEDILATIKACRHSRLPVYEGSIDKIVGILQIRKFIKSYLKEGNDLNISELIDEPYFVLQNTNIDDLLPLMSKNRQNIAIVTDNYGGTLGIVTIEDILEELVGEIWDEEDEIVEPIIRINDTTISVAADEHVEHIFDEAGFEDPEDDGENCDTVMSAWAFEKFGKIPKIHDCFDYHGLKIEVTEMDHNRIKRLSITVPTAEDDGGEEK